MSNVFFTADTHFGHKGIIVHQHRAFKSVEEMDAHMIERWNSMVMKGDRIYHLGDFAFTKPSRAVEILKQLNGEKYLVAGNHDKRCRANVAFDDEWVWIRDLTEIDVEEQRITLCHYPMLTWNRAHYGAWQLHGHSHGNLTEDLHSLRLDVGVDPNGFYPVLFSWVKYVMSTKTFKPVDHHIQRDDDR